MSQKADSPSKWWYLGHLFFWVITGLICYLLHKDANKPAAKKHLIHSLWIQPVATVIVFLIMALVAGFP